MNFTTTIPITENNRDYLLLVCYEGILILSILILFLQRALKKITIVSFNSAGLQKNPLEFEDGTDLLKMAEDIMKIDPTWNLSADKETKDRYSIIYDKTIPFGLSDEEFKQNWEIRWNEKYINIIPYDIQKFDKAVYHAITQVYSPQQVIDLFDRPYVNEKKKFDMLQNFVVDKLKGCGIVIVHEMLPDDVEKFLHGIRLLIPNKNLSLFSSYGPVVSIIITCEMDATLVSFPNVNKQTVAIKILNGSLKNYLVVGSHFTSKPDADAPENKGYQSNYNDLSDALVDYSKYIVAFDANHEIDGINDPNRLPTSIKKRTKFQVQNKLDKVSKRIDYIAYSGHVIGNWETIFNIVTDSNVPVNMPHDQMPIDHAVRILTLNTLI
jgi:hypothetical protein